MSMAANIFVCFGALAWSDPLMAAAPSKYPYYRLRFQALQILPVQVVMLYFQQSISLLP